MENQRIEQTKPDHWDVVYLDWPLRWGKKPSLTGQLAAKVIDKKSTVVEVGPGAYPRDLLHIYAETGCEDLRLVEEASRGREMALERLTTEKVTAANYKGNFLNLKLPPCSVNVLFSHRVIHLFTNQQDCHTFEQRCFECIRPGGYLILGARDLRERDARMDSLVSIDNNVWEMQTRPGHFFRYWSPDRYREVFEARWDIEGFHEGEEVESYSSEGPSDVNALFTVMVARKKSKLTLQ